MRIRICSGSESSNSPNKRLENTEGAIKNGQSRETDNIAYTRRRQTKQKHNTICVRHHYTQANINKTWALLQTTGGKDEPNIVLCGNRNGSHNTELRTKRHIILT